MDQLWSPWRSSYVTGGTQRSSNECFLCQEAIEGSSHAESCLVFSSNTTIVVLNKYPYNAGHILVSPKRHVESFCDLDSNELCELIETIRRSESVLRNVYQPHGINVGANLGSAAGAGVPGHLHVHLIPRWNGDTNFMPVIGEVKVISEQLEISLGQLRQGFNPEGGG